MLTNCLTCLSEFTSLKTFTVTSIPVPSSQLDIPPKFASIRRSHGHPSLQTIELGSDMKFIWSGKSRNKRDLRRGWIYDGNSRDGTLCIEGSRHLESLREWAILQAKGPGPHDAGLAWNTHVQVTLPNGVALQYDNYGQSFLRLATVKERES